MTQLNNPAAKASAQWPSPSTGGYGLSGHLPRWGRDAIELLEDGARLGPVFEVRLWRRALVGYKPEWNRMVLSDLDAFRSRSSMSQLSPYLRGGVIALEAPRHRARRAALNPAFHRRAVAQLFPERFAAAVRRHLPTGVFDAVAWSSDLVRRLLADAFLGTTSPPERLLSFLAPLDARLPAPLLPRARADPPDAPGARGRPRRSGPGDTRRRLRRAAERGRGGEGRARRGLRHDRAHACLRTVGAGGPTGPEHG